MKNNETLYRYRVYAVSNSYYQIPFVLTYIIAAADKFFAELKARSECTHGPESFMWFVNEYEKPLISKNELIKMAIGDDWKEIISECERNKRTKQSK